MKKYYNLLLLTREEEGLAILIRSSIWIYSNRNSKTKRKESNHSMLRKSQI